MPSRSLSDVELPSVAATILVMLLNRHDRACPSAVRFRLAHLVLSQKKRGLPAAKRDGSHTVSAIPIFEPDSRGTGITSLAPGRPTERLPLRDRAQSPSEAHHTGGRGHRLPDGAAGFDHHYHSHSGYGAQPGHHGAADESRGDHLCADLSGLHSRQRMVRRSLRRPPDLRAGADRLHHRLRSLRHGEQLRDAHPHARPAGSRRGDDDAGGAADPAAQLSPRPALHGDDLYERAGAHRPRHRPLARRVHHHLCLLALDLLYQHPLRLPRHPAGLALRRGDPRHAIRRDSIFAAS